MKWDEEEGSPVFSWSQSQSNVTSPPHHASAGALFDLFCECVTLFLCVSEKGLLKPLLFPGESVLLSQWIVSPLRPNCETMVSHSNINTHTHSEPQTPERPIDWWLNGGTLPIHSPLVWIAKWIPYPVEHLFFSFEAQWDALCASCFIHSINQSMSTLKHTHTQPVMFNVAEFELNFAESVCLSM